MYLKNHPIIKKARTGKVVLMVVGLVMLLASVLCFVAKKQVKDNKTFSTVHFADAYNDERLGEDIYVYIDVTKEPYEIGHYNNAEQYYYVSDGYDLYILECSENEYDKIAEAVNNGESYRVTGTITTLKEEVIDTAIEIYNEGEDDPDEIISREDFDYYFQGVALMANGTSDVEGLALIGGILLLIFGLIAFISGMVQLSRFNGALKRINEMDAQMVAADLDSPQTVYIKQAKTYLTPRHLVSLGDHSAIIPYVNILWAYKYTHSINFIPVASNIKVMTSDLRTRPICDMKPLSGGQDRVVGQIFNAIAYYNPQARFGYTQDLKNYFNSLRYQPVNYNNVNNNVNNNAS